MAITDSAEREGGGREEGEGEEKRWTKIEKKHGEEDRGSVL